MLPNFCFKKSTAVSRASPGTAIKLSAVLRAAPEARARAHSGTGGNGAEEWHTQHIIDAAAINKTKAEGKQVCFCIGGPKTSSHAGGSHSGSPPGSSYQHGGSSYAHGGSSYAHGSSSYTHGGSAG